MEEIKRLQQLAGILNEDVSKFKIGQTSQSGGHKSTVTDVDPTTQSVTWNIKKDITDKEIWDDLTKLIKKFETVQVKDFHSRPKLIQLIKDLKTIRNKFSRTVVKEDKRELMKTLKVILNEVKINNPLILKSFNDYLEVLDFFGGELPDYYAEARDQAIKGGYKLTPDEFHEADQNSTFSEVKINKPTNLQVGKEYNIKMNDEGTEGDWEIAKLIHINPSKDSHLKFRFKTQFGDYFMTRDEVDSKVKSINNG